MFKKNRWTLVTVTLNSLNVQVAQLVNGASVLLWSCYMLYFLDTPVNLAYSVFNVHVKIILKQTTHFSFFFYHLSYG